MSESSIKIQSSSIIVMGVSGSGKSTVGLGLAKRLSCPFLEGDDFHLPSSVDKMAAGIALGDEDRWPWLSQLAAEIGKLVGQHGCVVASCSALKRQYRDRLRREITGPVIFIHLVAEPASLASRMSLRDGHYMPPSLLQSQLQSMEPPEDDENALVLTNDSGVASVIAAANAWVLSRNK